MIGYGAIGFGGLIWMLLFAALLVVPFWRILPRHGIASWVSLVAVIPLGALVLLWVVAFKGNNAETSNGG